MLQASFQNISKPDACPIVEVCPTNPENVRMLEKLPGLAPRTTGAVQGFEPGPIQAFQIGMPWG